MRQRCFSLLASAWLLTAIALFSSCTGGNEKGNQSVPVAAENEKKQADTSTSSIAPLGRSEHVATVEIKGMKFMPEKLAIHKGDTVVWVNNDLTSHCVTATGKTWTSSTIASGSSWKKVINENTDYYCAIHVVMKGRINVE
jgi:plastocyanin